MTSVFPLAIEHELCVPVRGALHATPPSVAWSIDGAAAPDPHPPASADETSARQAQGVPTSRFANMPASFAASSSGEANVSYQGRNAAAMLPALGPHDPRPNSPAEGYGSCQKVPRRPTAAR